MKYATRAIFPVVAYTQLLRAGPVASYDGKERGNSKKAYQEKGLLQIGLLQKGLPQKGLPQKGLLQKGLHPKKASLCKKL